jgi:hypothetical protein
MWKSFWICAGAAAGLAMLLVWVSANSVFLYRHPRSPSTRIVVDSATGAAVVMKPVRTLAADAPAHPKLELPEAEYDFGTMNTVTAGTHAFVVRNVGEGPLALKVGPTSCKCTVAGLDKNEIPPGQQATIQLDWTTGRLPLYSHYATIFTNDPSRKSFDLTVHGKVQMLFQTDVSEIVLPSLLPGEPATAELLLFSQVWDSLSVEKLDSPLPGLKWEVESVEPASAEMKDARCARRLRLSIPAGLPVGELASSVRLTLAGPGDAGEHTLDLPLYGTVQPRISLIGGDTDQHGNIELGSLPQGRGRRINLLVKVRDRQAGLDKLQISTFPDFLQASLRPRSEGQARGLYDLVIEIPQDAPVGQFRGSPLGEVRIDTGDPRLGSVKLGVTFAILPPAGALSISQP